MNRRNALKQIGLGLGYTAIAPTALSILQSCKAEVDTWTPLFFSEDEGYVIKQMIDIMLPKTKKTPGALDVNVPQFIDLYASKVYNSIEIEAYKLGINSIMEELPITDEGVKKLTHKDYDTLLSKYLKADKNTQKQYRKDKNLTYDALVNLRNQAVWAFKNSEEIGENVLAYDPIPGIQKGCITLQEATGGKAWSL